MRAARLHDGDARDEPAPGRQPTLRRHAPGGARSGRIDREALVRAARPALGKADGYDDALSRALSRLRAAASFEQEDGGTRVTVRMEWASPAVRDAMRELVDGAAGRASGRADLKVAD